MAEEEGGGGGGIIAAIKMTIEREEEEEKRERGSFRIPPSQPFFSLLSADGASPRGEKIAHY